MEMEEMGDSEDWEESLGGLVGNLFFKVHHWDHDEPKIKMISTYQYTMW